MTVLGYRGLGAALAERGQRIPERTLRTLARAGKISCARLGHRTLAFQVETVSRELGR